MNAIRDELPDATAVLDAFHVVKLAGNALDEVRRRVQQAALHRRGHKDDPHYRIRRTLLTGPSTSPTGNDSGSTATYPSATRTGSRTRLVHLPGSPQHLPRRVAGALAASKPRSSSRALHTCPIKEIAPLGRTPRQWRAEILAYFTTGGVSNGGTEDINGVIEKTRRLAHGFRNFTNYRIRILLAADGSRPYRRQP